MQAVGFVSHYVKAIFSETAEIRLLRLNRAVAAILESGGARWDRRRNARGKTVVMDVLIVREFGTWERLLPYFSFDLEKEHLGARHRANAVREIDE